MCQINVLATKNHVLVTMCCVRRSSGTCWQHSLLCWRMSAIQIWTLAVAHLRRAALRTCW